MDILDIHAEIKNFRSNGVTLNLDERIQLENSLMKLQISQKQIEELHLWGKITGINADYYIAVGYIYSGMYEFPVKKFYWALSKDFEFSELPELNDQHKNAVNYANAYFEGNPKKILVKVKKEGEEGGAEGDKTVEDGAGEDAEGGAAKAKAENLSDLSEDEEIKIPPKDLSELDRLTFIVYAIENDCSIAPVGAFKMTPLHQVRRNEAFHGLQADQDLQSYLHFRNVQTQAYKEQLDQPGAPFNPNFLESIIDDQPRGLWTIQGGKDHDDKIITIRSIMWPGFIFYHKAGTKKFGNLYIGDGLKNEELHFMI